MIQFYFEDCQKFSFPERKFVNWLSQTIEENGFETGDISIIFCTDTYLLSINKEYLKHNYFTDIITFNYNESGFISGDLFISIDRIHENAEELGLPFDLELKRVVVHGILHLIGFNDKTEDEQVEMRKQEDYYIRKIEDVE